MATHGIEAAAAHQPVATANQKVRGKRANMADDFDLDEALRDDMDKGQKMVQRYDRDRGFQWPPLAEIAVQAAFTLGMIALLIFLAMLPFVGESKVVPPEVWIGGGMVFLALFFMIGMGMKAVKGLIEG